MHLTHQELRSLALFLAKRFPSPADISPLACTARLDFDPTGPDDAEADWFALLATAHEQGRLEGLVRAASAACPEDENMVELQAILAPQRSNVVRLVAVGAVVGVAATALLTAGLVAWGLSGDDAVAAQVSTQRDVPVAASVVTPDEATPAEVVDLPPQPEPVEEPAEAPQAAPVATPAPQGTADAALPEPCAPSADEEVLGWWYAGETAPGAAGEVVSVPRTLNVRADYPGHHNAYDARAEVRCILLEGTALTLHKDPKKVPPGHFWVPLTAADLP